MRRRLWQSFTTSCWLVSLRCCHSMAWRHFSTLRMRSRFYRLICPPTTFLSPYFEEWNEIATELDLYSLGQSEFGAHLRELGESGFRTRRLFSWLYQKEAQRFEETSNLPRSLREALKEHARLPRLVQGVVQVSKSDDTKRYLFLSSDGNIIEDVLICYNYGNSVYISSQVGCYMDCRFCTSTVDGLTRNLTAGKMLAQVYTIE